VVAKGVVVAAAVLVSAVYSDLDLAVVEDYLVGLVDWDWGAAGVLILISETYSKTVHMR
jgi:hypothetical protein